MDLYTVAHLPYNDPDEFIREVTDRIWVDRDIAFINDNYESDAIVHGALGTTAGRQPVIDGSLARVATTPERIGQAEDVVWEARGRDAFMSSHLVFSSNPVSANGVSIQVRSRGIANCLYRRGRMVEEWVVRDELARTLQLGKDPDAAAALVEFRGFTGSIAQPPPEDVLSEGISGARPDDFRTECRRILEFFGAVWNSRNLSLVPEFVVRDFFLHTVGDRTIIRPRRYQEELLDLVGAFPDARFDVYDIQTNYSVRYAGLRVGVLWKMVGTHSGTQKYGPPTHSPIEVLGSSQFLVQDGLIVREVRVYDEIAVRAQVRQNRDAAASVDCSGESAPDTSPLPVHNIDRRVQR